MASFCNCLLHYLLWLFIMGVLQTGIGNVPTTSTDEESNSSVNIGAVFDWDSPEGAIANISISLAVSDFYAMHPSYQTRLSLHTRSPKNLIGTATAVVDLLENVQVHAIIGPHISAAVPFIIEIGEKAQVPIVSVFETSPTLSLTENPYFIRATQDDSVQVKAIAAILQNFEWYEAILIYEDTDYGDGIISYLANALQEIDIQLAHLSAIPTSAKDCQISRELMKLMTRQTRVFIVHMTGSLGSRLFALADKVGMMSEGYAWLITAGLSNSLNAMDSEVIDSMEGVVGIRSYVPKSKKVENFKGEISLHLKKKNTSVSEVNIYGLWAYDTIWALARAVGRIGPTNPSFSKLNIGKGSTDFESLGTSTIGPQLRKEMLNTKFKGLSGEYHLVNGQMQSSTFEIFNVIGGKGERVVGYWTPKKGLSQKLDSTSNSGLKKIIWPGVSTKIPKGWAITHLKVGIPVKRGFNEFVSVDTNDPMSSTGFCIDVFRAVLSVLEFNISYDFVPYKNATGEMNGTYSELLHQIEYKNYEAVVGDTTILESRTKYVDFTMPYTESGVAMLVPVKHDKHRDMWIFHQPWSRDLWLTAIAACIFMGLVIRIMERRNANIGLGRPLIAQLGMTLWLPFYALGLPERELVARDCSRFVLVIWISLAFILMQSYTASLSSILTVDKLQPTYVSVKELQKQGYFVGYQSNSFVKDLLVNQLNFKASKLKSYNSVREYHKALSRGSQNGGVAAIFDEIPYIKVFLAHKNYGSKYMIAGPTYRTDGFGFAFPRYSPLVAEFSRAVLKVRELGREMDKIEEKYFGHTITSLDVTSSISTDRNALQAYSFGGLFIIVGIVTLLALLISESYLWRRPIALAKKYSKKCFPSSQPSNENESVTQSTAETDVSGDSPEVETMGNSQRISSYIIETISTEENFQNSHSS